MFKTILFAAAGLVLSGFLLEHTGTAPLMTAGGFLAALADDALQVRTNTRLQAMFPSEQRATLISIECFTFSLIMIVLSPLAGGSSPCGKACRMTREGPEKQNGYKPSREQILSSVKKDDCRLTPGGV